MKSIITFLILFLGLNALAQTKGYKVEYRFNKSQAFFAVSDGYEIDLLKVYHSFGNFRVFADYIPITHPGDSQEYLVFEYSDFSPIKANKKSNDDNTTVSSQGGAVVHLDLYPNNRLKLAILRTDFENLINLGEVEEVYSLKPKHSLSATTGFMSIPFKLRPAISTSEDDLNFSLTTDVTLGAYLGMKFRISRMKDNFIVIPFTAGLSYINTSSDNVLIQNSPDSPDLVPGISWSSGLILQFNGVNIGVVLGKDYASNVGSDWVYNDKFWWSFSIGHTFLKED